MIWPARTSAVACPPLPAASVKLQAPHHMLAPQVLLDLPITHPVWHHPMPQTMLTAKPLPALWPGSPCPASAVRVSHQAVQCPVLRMVSVIALWLPFWWHSADSMGNSTTPPSCLPCRLLQTGTRHQISRRGCPSAQPSCMTMGSTCLRMASKRSFSSRGKLHLSFFNPSLVRD